MEKPKYVGMQKYQITPTTLYSKVGGRMEDILLGLEVTICGKLVVSTAQVKN